MVEPVERLVGERVGVHEYAAVRLEHEQPGGERKVRGESPGVVDGTPGNDETHLKSLASPSPVVE